MKNKCLNIFQALFFKSYHCQIQRILKNGIGMSTAGDFFTMVDYNWHQEDIDEFFQFKTGIQMIEGWLDDEYLILYSKEEAVDANRMYKLDEIIPGYKIIGISGWDQFIVKGPDNRHWTVPTVPINLDEVEEYCLPMIANVEADNRFTNKIKWYVKPLIFGGDVEDPSNLNWITHQQHIELVVWWNQVYQTEMSKIKNV